MEESAAFELFPSDAGAGLESRLMEELANRSELAVGFPMEESARAGLESRLMEELANRYGTGGRRSDGRIRPRVNRSSQTPAVIAFENSPSGFPIGFQTQGR